MSQDLTALDVNIFSAGLEALREEDIMPLYVNRDYDTEFGQKGSVVKVSVGSDYTIQDVTPGVTPQVPQDSTPSTVDITLDYWKVVPFFITAKERARIEADKTFMPGAVTGAMRTISNFIESTLSALYADIPAFVGTAGTTPFASDVTLIPDVATQLAIQRTPPKQRAFLIDPYAYGAASKVALFQQAQQAGDTGVIREGAIGRRFGFDMDSPTSMPKHTAGTASSATVTVSDSASLGDAVLKLKVSSATATLKAGDCIRIGSAAPYRYYTITADATLDTTGVSVSFKNIHGKQLLLAAESSTTPVVVPGTATTNLAFHRDAFALAMRALSTDDMPAGTRSGIIMDQKTRMPFRLDVIPQFFQTAYYISILFGVKTIRPEFAVRVLG